MIVLELDGVEIDYCLGCGGIWLDAGELEILTNDPARAVQILEEAQNAGSGRTAKRRCPICRKRMEILLIGPEGNIEIDGCGKKHGLWFDRGELEAVLSFFCKQKNSQLADLLRHIFISDNRSTH